MTTKRGEAAAIVPSEMKGRKHPMTDDEFTALLARERREIEERGGKVVDKEWRHKNVRGMGVQGDGNG